MRICFILAVVVAVTPAFARRKPPKATTNPAEVEAILHPPATAPAFADAERAIEKYKIPDGLKMTAWAAEPQLANPVALHMDNLGRAWVVETFRFEGGGEGTGVYDIRHMYDNLDDDLASKTVEQRLINTKKWEHGDLTSRTTWPDRIRLIEDRDGDGKADHSTIFAEFQEAMDGIASGVLTRGDDVYVTNIPNLWLLRDEDHDGVADMRKSLSYGYGVRYSFLGHDLHGLRFGPDGKLYFSNGDRGMHVVTPEGKTLDYPDTGTVMRCNPDGSNLEVFATGLRNPQKLVFDEYGNLFTGDNNADYGEPARWVYVVEGGDSGWRVGYQHIKTPKPGGPWLAEHLTNTDNGKNDGAAYMLPPIAHIASGPSGCTYYPGVGLPEAYNGHFFLVDFRAGPLSLIHTFAMKPKGAGFEVTDLHPFVEHLVATDLEFAPDGGLYITDWNDGWNKVHKGRMYKVVSPDAQKNPLVLETKKLLGQGMSGRSIEELAKLLAHADMRVRQEAQFELARRGGKSVPLLNEIAAANPSRLARIHAIWALSQIGQEVNSLIPLLEAKDDEVRAQATKVLGEARICDPVLLAKRLKDSSPRVRYFAALGAGRLGAAGPLDAVLAMIRDNDDKDLYLRHAGVMALAGIGDVSGIINAAKNAGPSSVRMAAVLALSRMVREEVAQFLDEPSPRVVLEAARAINDVPIEAAMDALAKQFERTDLSEPVMLRVLNANFRLGKPENAKAVAACAVRAEVPEDLRVEALTMLHEWDKPNGKDRVIGVWRPLPPRDPSIVRAAARPIIAGIVTKAPDQVRLAAIELVKKIGVDDPTLLFKTVTNKETSSEVAAAALLAMKELKDPKLTEAVDHSLAHGKGAARTQAIKLLIDRPNAVAQLDDFLAHGSVSDQQAVLLTLGNIDNPAADDILARWVEKLVSGTCPPELQLDLAEAAAQSTSKSIKKTLAKFNDAHEKDDPLTAYRMTLAGGDAALGRKIFFERTDVSCLRCHKIASEGGVVGPDLSAVGSRHDRPYLLESIIDPNKTIAPGYESASVKMKAGKSYTGVVKADTDNEIVLDAGDGATVHVDKSQIATRSKGVSPMPTDLVKPLSKRDVRNLIEFLASQKQPATTQTAKAPVK